jgi:PTH1 family peptidyl-tRNA hydrolase
MKVVVGLGNPAKKYEKTRHNAGFMVIDRFSRVSEIKLHNGKHLSLFGTGEIGSERVLLVKPLTYVNRSGRAIRSFMHYYSFDPQDLLVIYDDMDLNLGKIRIRSEGSAGGHKGVESIILAIGSRDFSRIRIGIGKGDTGPDTDFVLGKFSKDEEPVIERAIERSVAAIEIIIREGLSAAMNMFN